MKRLLSGLVAALLLTALLPSAALAAETAPNREEAAQVLAALDIMVGDGTGNLNLGATVTRAEFTKLVMAASPWKDGVGGEATVSPYPDVPKNNWAAPWVQAAVEHGLVNGYLDGTFRPTSNIKLAEGVVMVLRLLGYENSDFTGAFPSGQMATFRSLGLDKGITAGQNDTITRQDAMFLFYNLLTVKTKVVITASGATGGVYYLNVIWPNDKLVNENGEFDKVALMNKAMEGPVVVGAGWQNKIPFSVANAKVYRAGVASTPAAITTNDVVYWSKSMQTLWAYTNRATGSLESVTPASAPTSVTVAGKTYSIETSSAALALSDLGSYRVGDSVTLLLGRDNQVAAVLASKDTNSTVYGMVTEVKPSSYTDASGQTYTTSTITVQGTDGNVYTYPWEEKTSRAGALVQVTTGSGSVQVKRLSSATLNGKVNSAGTRIGDYELSSDVQILDTYGDSLALKIYPARLAGVEIKDSMVRYYQKDSDGKIDILILKDVVGDFHTYGILTSTNVLNTDMATSGTYGIQVGTETETIQGAKVYNIKQNPVIIKRNGTEIDRFANLTEARITSVDGSVAVADNQRYLISENVAVYTYKDDKYYPSSLSLVQDGSYTLTGWYDKPTSEGGAIRVIIAR